MAKVGVGLDIGTRGVKVVRVSGDSTFRVNRFAAVPLDEGAIDAGVVADRKAVAAAVREVLRAGRIKGKRVVVAIAGQAVVVRNIKMPLMEDEEAANAIRWEAERYIPYPVDEVTLDFEIIDRDMEEGEMEVILACAHNDIIRSHLEVLWETGLQPLAIDVQPFAMMRGLGIEYSRPAESVAMLDIGAASSDLVIARAAIPYFTRILPVGGNRLTELVAKYAGLEGNEAETAKKTVGNALAEPGEFSQENREYQVNMGLKAGLKDLALELRRSFDYYQLQHKGENISRLILSGGSALINNLPAFLAKELEVEVSVGVYDERVRCPKALFERFQEQSPVYTVALGLAMREVTEE